jgi:Gpi18-like mannosyltransferase
MPRIRAWFVIVVISLFSLLLFWSPFLLKVQSLWGIDFNGRSMQTIVTNFDGANFLIVAKTLYDPHQIEVDFPSILSGRKNLYFSAHYPGMPLLIKLFDSVLSGPNALLMAIVTSNALLALALFWFFRHLLQNDKLAVYLAVLSLFVPARMLSMRGVGSNESLFIFFVLTSLLASSKQKHWISALLGSGAVLTRSPGILLFAAYFLMIWVHKANFLAKVKNTIPYLLIPLTLLGLWVYYGIVFNDFFAYFKVGGNINLHFPPFMVFASNFDWVSGMWLEDIIYTYIFYGVGIILFWKNFASQKQNYKAIGYFGIIYLAMLAFIVHRDVARYALPIAPLAIAGFSSYVNSKYFKIGLAILIIPVFLFSWNFILNNVQPIMDWAPYL